MTKENPIHERQFFAKDALIMREGDRGHKAYLIQSGTVLVYTTDEDGETVELATLEAGQIIGEMTLVFEGARSANVKALEDCNLIVISRATFNEKLKKSDPTVRAIVGMLTERVSLTNHALVKQDAEIEELARKTRAIYRSALEKVPPDVQDTFKAEILPKLDALFEALQPYGAQGQKRIKDLDIDSVA